MCDNSLHTTNSVRNSLRNRVSRYALSCNLYYAPRTKALKIIAGTLSALLHTMNTTHETYFDSAADVEITKTRALKEVAAHGSSVADFLAEMGEREIYDAQAVLVWLGY